MIIVAGDDLGDFTSVIIAAGDDLRDFTLMNIVVGDDIRVHSNDYCYW